MYMWIISYKPILPSKGKLTTIDMDLHFGHTSESNGISQSMINLYYLCIDSTCRYTSRHSIVYMGDFGALAKKDGS